MFAKRFFYVCVGLFLLALTLTVHSRLAGVAKANTTAPISVEVPTLSGVLADGQTIPLPVYADGTTALESECKWIVSLHHIGSGPPPGGEGWWRDEMCGTDGRQVRCYAYSYRNGEWGYITGDVNYLILATRNSGAPTPAQRESFGSVKARYR